MWEKNPTVTFRRILTDPYNKLGCLLSISQLIKKASCFLNITPAVVHLWESFNPSVNTTHIHQKFPFFSSSFKHQGPSPLPGFLQLSRESFTFCPFPTLLDHIFSSYSGHLLSRKVKLLWRKQSASPAIGSFCERPSQPLPMQIRGVQSTIQIMIVV